MKRSDLLYLLFIFPSALFRSSQAIQIYLQANLKIKKHFWPQRQQQWQMGLGRFIFNLSLNQRQQQQLLLIQKKRNMSKQDHDRSMKVLLIGNSSVGKSNILMRFAENKFQQSMMNTIGVDFKLKYVNTNGERVKVVLWDTAGQQRFRTITNSYYRGADGIIIVYDITNRDSFDNVSMWYDQMSTNINQKVVCILVGNKLDMSQHRAVSTQQGRQVANRYGMPFAETSAKTGQNISQVFQKLISMAIQNSQNRGSSRPKLKPPQHLVQNSKNEEQYCTCCGN